MADKLPELGLAAAVLAGKPTMTCPLKWRSRASFTVLYDGRGRSCGFLDLRAMHPPRGFPVLLQGAAALCTSVTITHTLGAEALDIKVTERANVPNFRQIEAQYTTTEKALNDLAENSGPSFPFEYLSANHKAFAERMIYVVRHQLETMFIDRVQQHIRTKLTAKQQSELYLNYFENANVDNIPHHLRRELARVKSLDTVRALYESPELLSAAEAMQYVSQLRIPAGKPRQQWWKRWANGPMRPCCVPALFPFEWAREYTQKQLKPAAMMVDATPNVVSNKWHLLVKHAPVWMPSSPEIVYRDTGWDGWQNWFHNKINKRVKYKTLKEAKAYLANFTGNVREYSEWWAKEQPVDLPRALDKYYNVLWSEILPNVPRGQRGAGHGRSTISAAAVPKPVVEVQRTRPAANDAADDNKANKKARVGQSFVDMCVGISTMSAGCILSPLR